MKKSLIALAIAAAAPAAFAATSNVDVYGLVSVAYETGDTNNGYVDMKNTRIGVKGTEDLGGGMSAIYKAEFLVADINTSTNTTATNGDTALKNRDTFLGLKGNFGTVIMGNHASPQKLGMGANQFEDTIADKSQILGEEAGYKDRVVAYISPDFNGFHAGVAAVTVSGTASDTVAGTSYVLAYANGPMTATVGGTSYDAATSADSTAVTLGYTVADVAMRLTNEKSKNSTDAGENWTSNYFDATYKMGPMDLTAAYGKKDIVNSTADKTATTLGARYNLSKRTNVQLIWNKLATSGSADVTDTALQVNHAF